MWNLKNKTNERGGKKGREQEVKTQTFPYGEQTDDYQRGSGCGDVLNR